MSNLQFSVLSQPKKPASSQGARSMSWASVNNTLYGFQSLNFQSSQMSSIPIPNQEYHNITKTIQKIFPGQEQQNKKANNKMDSPTKQPSKSNAYIASSYTQQTKNKKGNINGSSKVNQLKVSGSLPNLLMVPVPQENNFSEINSPKEKIAAEQKKRVINQIACNFRFKPGHNNQSPGLKKNPYSHREKIQIEPNSINLLSARLESSTKDKSSARKSSARQIGLKSTDKPNQLFQFKGDSLRDFTGFEDEISPTTFKGNKALSYRSMGNNSGLRHDETEDFTKAASKAVSVTERKLHRPQSTQKLVSYKAINLDSKVTEQQRERFAMFIKDEFVNDLIYTKYYQVMDEEEKANAMNNLKQKMVQNKSIREKFHETMNGADKNFFDQFNLAHKTPRQNALNSAQNQSKSGIEPSSPMSPHIYGFAGYQANELFSPKDSPLEDTKSRLTMNPLFEGASPRQQTKPKSSDYYINLELTKSMMLDESKKKKKKPEILRMGTTQLVAMQKERYSRIRKCLQEKLIKCVELKVTAEEMAKNIKIFTTKPFEKQGSYAFLKAAKYGDTLTITQYLEQDRFYVLEYDTLKQTPLHWAVKKGHLDICNILIQYRADVDAIDMGGRTPLYYALREDNPEIVRILLAAKASPWSIRGHNYIECCNTEKAKRYLSKARQLSLLLAFHKIKDRAAVWSREVNKFLAYIGDDKMENFLMVRRAERLD